MADFPTDNDPVDISADAEEFATFFNPSTCVRRGLCPVTKIRHQDHDTLPPQSHSLYFEQHGSGPENVIFIMGLNSSMFAWHAQVDYFGSYGRYSVVVFDNRGVGNSETPKGPYTTSGMAEDVIVLLDYIGWKENRSVHVVGISLGGMIAQELATRIPERIISLTLAVTTPGGVPWNNLPSWKGLLALLRLLTVHDLAIKIPIILDISFPSQWLDARDESDERGRTNREVQFELYARRLSHTRPQTLTGAISQMCAALTHHVSNSRLQSMGRALPKITLITGDEDFMVNPRGSHRIWDALIGDVAADDFKKLKEFGGVLGNVELVKWEKTGHPVHIQWPARFNALLERVFSEGKRAALASK